MGIQTHNGGFLSGMMADILEDFEAKAREARYFDDPVLWAKHKLGVTLWYKQAEIAEAIATGPLKSVAVRAGHGVGKSFLSAILAAWWIDTRPIQYVFVASTAPSSDQVTAILWREIRNAWMLSHQRYAEYLRLTKLGHPTGDLPSRPLPGTITQDNRWKDDLGNLIGQGRKPPDHNEDAFQGIHAQYVLAIGDEACGLNVNMIDSLANITSNAKSRRLLIANPTNPRSRFGEIFLEATGAWSLHHISVLDSPNFHGGGKCIPGCPLKVEHDLQPYGLGLDEQALESLTDMSYVVEKRLEYGETSARYRARVLGEFAYDAGNNVFEDYDIAKARDAVAFIDYEDPGTRTYLGVDVARSKNGDVSFIYRYTTGLMHDWFESVDADGSSALVMGPVGSTVGGELRYVDSFRDTPLVDRYEEDGTLTIGQATLVHNRAIEYNAFEVRVDSGGLGIGLVDGLRKLAYDPVKQRFAYRVFEMQGGAPTPDGRQWTNNRAYQIAQMRDRFRVGTISIDPADRLLITQLEDILGDFVDPHGALQIESKASMKKKGMKSPDAADAAWYACANLAHLDGIQPGDVIRKSAGQLLLEREKQMILNGFKDGSEF